MKTRWIDRLLTTIGSALLASPSSLTTKDGELSVGKGFYHRPHRRRNIRNSGINELLRSTTVHYFRMDFCQRIAARISLITGVVSVAIGILAVIIK